MARTRKQDPEPAESPARKRARHDEADEEPVNGTPSKRRRSKTTQKEAGDADRDPYEVPSDDDGEEAADSEPETHTPTKRKAHQPKSATPANGAVTPSKLRQVNALVTPVKATGANGFTPRRRQAADRSARRKSARALIERVVADEDSEEDEEGLAREIYESSEEEEEAEHEPVGKKQKQKQPEAAPPPVEAPATEPDTPSATPRKRGRPRKQPPPPKSPTPPRELAPHELYFEHNKPGRAKTSHNTLSSLDLLSHDEYFELLRAREEPHAEDLAFLQSLHEASFEQWCFELAQGFGLCLFGQGSKRDLTAKLALHLYAADPKAPIVVVNGYVRTITPRDVFTTVATALSPSLKLPAQPAGMLQTLSSALTSHPKPVTLIFNCIDAAPLRKPATQQLLSQLAAHPRVRFVATADTPSFPLLWDAAQRTSFNFLFHDCTTLKPLDVELDTVDDVHELLGRKARRVNGKEGAMFVLRSLSARARELFQLIVTEVLLALDDDDGNAHQLGAENPGLEYNTVYRKAEENFISTSEVAFRTLLKEFHDHQMIISKKDAFGTELLSLPFKRDELEAILEEMVV
ncbi:Origin recognition complex subunit 2 [Colletotrichum gloeosporioides]|uniref:Origin recognition complex subunit 2 n=1 Tax=Colletotrichum gloeosporioides TaxID=474922 RepID=A0A8H4CIN3_COLGL|nr:Origin recognition complex subunit 2 [Colletotrichum gloeosporioides]KAF3804496.1 Origin recognition complex subunit 2 [Colletotrichum gloeosporioides]